MKQSLLRVARTVFGIMIATCLVSTMVIFMGGDKGGADMRALILTQAAVGSLALVVTLFGLYFFVTANGWRQGFRSLWRAVPQWLVFAVILLNSLLGAGELSFFLISQAMEQAVSWHEHIPLICMLFCSLAFCVLYAMANTYPGSRPAMAGRWP